MSKAAINREISNLETLTSRNLLRFNPRVASMAFDALNVARVANRRRDSETAKRALANARAFVLSCESEA